MTRKGPCLELAQRHHAVYLDRADHRGEPVAGQAKIPHAVRRLLRDALAVSDLLSIARAAGDEVIDSTAVDITNDDQPPALTASCALPARCPHSQQPAATA